MDNNKIPVLQSFNTGLNSDPSLSSYPLPLKPEASQPQPMEVPQTPSEGKTTEVIQPGVNQ